MFQGSTELLMHLFGVRRVCVDRPPIASDDRIIAIHMFRLVLGQLRELAGLRFFRVEPEQDRVQAAVH